MADAGTPPLDGGGEPITAERLEAFDEAAIAELEIGRAHV